MYLCISVFYHAFLCNQQLETFIPRNKPQKRKLWSHKVHTNESLNLQNSHEKKFWTKEIPAREILESQNTHEKKIFNPQKIHDKKIGTHEIPKKTWCHDTARPRRPKMVHGFYYKYVYWNLVMLEFTCKNDQLKHGMSYYHVHRIKVSIKAFSITNSCCLKRQCW